MFSDSCRSCAAIINVTEPSGVHLIKSVMVVLTVKSNEVILNIVELRLGWACSKTYLMPFFFFFFPKSLLRTKAQKVGTMENVFILKVIFTIVDLSRLLKATPQNLFALIVNKEISSSEELKTNLNLQGFM